MTHMRYWLAWRLLELARWVHPHPAKRGRVWQVIEVPRRITQTEADQFAAMVKDY